MKTKKLISKSLLAIFTFLTLFLSSCSKKTSENLTVGFYKIKPDTSKGLEKSIENFYKDSSKKVFFKYIDNENELKDLIHSKSVHIVFTSAGINQKTCAEFANKKLNISNNLESDFTTSVRHKIISDNNKLIASPVLTDNYEIDISIYDYQVSSMNGINSWNDIEEFLSIQKQKKNTPLYFAGADSVDFFDMLGALCEAIDGPSYYEKSLEILNESGNPKDIAYKLIGSATSPMVKTSTLLKNYLRKGYIAQDSFNLSAKELENYAREGYAKMMLMSLSSHRTINNETIRQFSSIYMPSDFPAANRIFTANTLYAVPVNSHSELNDFINRLYIDENQTLLSRNTGLAPVSRTCKTPDKQADDARYWIAATNPPYAGLGHDTKTSENDLDKIKDCIKTILIYE